MAKYHSKLNKEHYLCLQVTQFAREVELFQASWGRRILPNKIKMKYLNILHVFGISSSKDEFFWNGYYTFIFWTTG